MRIDVKKVNEALLKSGISYDGFAEKFGIHRTYVYNVVNGIAEPGRKFFGAWYKFCKAYELDFMGFFIFDD